MLKLLKTTYVMQSETLLPKKHGWQPTGSKEVSKVEDGTVGPFDTSS
jgi:hypothetical protein